MRALISFFLLLASILLAVTWFQDDIIFPVDAVPAPGPLPSGTERLQVTTPAGDTLHGVHVRPAESADESRTLILGFGGNAWNGVDVASYLHDVFPHAHVVTFHYRGYRPSTGSPSAEALLNDAPLAFDTAVARFQPDRTIVIGFSIGSGVAASLAKRRPVDGFILVTPFDSLKAVARDLYPWLPIGPLFRHEIDAGAALRGSDVPVAIIAAERDEIVAPARTEALRKETPNLVFNQTIPGAGHNDIYVRSEFQLAMREAFGAIGGGLMTSAGPR